jgi:hypothetical protein
MSAEQLKKKAVRKHAVDSIRGMFDGETCFMN